jgi:hypothetical protein
VRSNPITFLAFLFLSAEGFREPKGGQSALNHAQGVLVPVQLPELREGPVQAKHGFPLQDWTCPVMVQSCRQFPDDGDPGFLA